MPHGHSLGHMEDVMDIIFTAHKGRHFDMGDSYHLYKKITEKGVQINDKSTITQKQNIARDS